MTATPTTPAELFRSLDLSLTVRAATDEEGAWACVLLRPDGATYDIESVTFFDVDPDTGEEWAVEPSPTRVLGVLAGGEVDAEDEADVSAAAAAETEARAFLGDEAFELLLQLEEDALEEG